MFFLIIDKFQEKPSDTCDMQQLPPAIHLHYIPKTIQNIKLSHTVSLSDILPHYHGGVCCRYFTSQLVTKAEM